MTREELDQIAPTLGDNTMNDAHYGIGQMVDSPYGPGRVIDTEYKYDDDGILVSAMVQIKTIRGTAEWVDADEVSPQE